MELAVGDFIIGERVYWGNRTPSITTYEVTKVGSKYIYVKSDEDSSESQ